MRTRQITLTAIIAIITLLTLAVFATGTAATGVAYADGSQSGTVKTLTSGSYFTYATEGGASTDIVFDIDELVTDTKHTTGNLALAQINYRENAAIEFTGDLLRAVKSNRLSAALYVSGTVTMAVEEGEFSDEHDCYFSLGVGGSATGSIRENYVYSDFIIPESEDFAHTVTFTKRTLLTSTKLEALLADEGEDSAELDISCGLTICATNQSAIEDTVTATVTASGSLEFFLELSFEKVRYDVGVEGNGSVTLGGTQTVRESTSVDADFGSVVSYEAEADDGYYFINWTGTSASQTSVAFVISFGAAVDIPSGTTYSYTAHYGLIAVEDGNVTEFVYNGAGVGPRVTVATIANVYYVKHTYTGTSASGHTSESEAKPVAVGTYNYHCDVYRDADRTVLIGHATRDFVITPAELTVTLEERQTLSFGNTGRFVNFEYEAAGVPGEDITTSVKIFDGSDRELTAPANAALYDNVIPCGTVTYRLVISPSGMFEGNYNDVEKNITVTVEDNFTVTGTELDEDAGRIISKSQKSIVTYRSSNGITDNHTDAILSDYQTGDELIKIELEAQMGTADTKIFFLGWRVGLYDEATEAYIYKYYTAGSGGYQFVYYVRSCKDLADEAERYKYTHIRFEAVFVKDLTAGNSDTIRFTYSGGSQTTSTRFSLGTGAYRFGTDNFYYQEFGTGLDNVIAPYVIGNHTLTYDVYNNELNVQVGSRVIAYIIEEADVTATVDETTSTSSGGYNKQYGWARNMYYTLNVPGLNANGVTAYKYSIDGGTTWNDATGTVAGNNKLDFVTPDSIVPAGEAAVINFLFRAVGTMGAETDYVIAQSKTPVNVKIDRYVPEIVSLSYVEGYSDAWQKSEVRFVARVRYGSSGAVLRYSQNGTTYTLASVKSGTLEYSGGDVVYSTPQVADVVFSVAGTSINSDITFQVRSAAGSTSVYGTQYRVRIDGIAPVIENTGVDTVPLNGWYKDATTVTFLISDSGGSALKEVYEENGLLTVTDGNDGTFSVRLTDNKKYVLIATDNAGQETRQTVQYNVDTAAIVYELASDSYVAGAWTNADAVVKYRVTAGGSGLRMSYSVNGGVSYTYCSGAAFTYPEGAEQGLTSYVHTLSYAIPAVNGSINYFFKIENAAGRSVVVEFGSARFDTTVPEITVLTDLSQYQSGWYQESVIAEFKVAAEGGSSLKSVTVNNGGVITYDATNDIYRLEIVICTPYTVTASDNAGNVTTEVLQANIDIVIPELDIKAYIGGGNPEDITEEASTSEVYAEYDFISWITEANEEPWIRFEFTINLTASGSRLQYSNNNGATWIALTQEFMPAAGEITGTVKTRTYITAEQNRPYIFRLITGSGAEYRYYPLGDTNVALVRIDFTAPIVEYETFSNPSSNNFPLKTEWTAESTRWLVGIADTAGGSGSGIDVDSIKLMQYDMNVSDEDILNGSQGALCNLTNSGAYYSFLFTQHKKYRFSFADMAGNSYVSEIFESHIDATRDFGVALEVKTLTDGVAGGYVQDAWLNANQSVRFTAKISGITEFGPSGAKLEASTDGGKTWRNTGATLNQNDMNFVYTASNDQYNVYRFRVITGAGVFSAAIAEKDDPADEDVTEFTVYKDNAALSVSVAVAYANGTSYGGGWTAETLHATVVVAAGAAGGELYLGDNVVFTVRPNDPRTYTYLHVVEEAVNGSLEFVFKSHKAVDGTPLSATGSALVKYDDSDPSIEIITDSGLPSGAWQSGTVTVSPEIAAGISGVAQVSYAMLEGDSWCDFIELDEDSYGVGDILYSVQLSVNSDYVRVLSVRYKVVTNTGKIAFSEIYELKIDNFVPVGSLQLNGTKVGSGVYADWYLTNVEVVFDVTVGDSGANVEYKYCDKSDYVSGDPASSQWSTWTKVEGLSAVLTDLSPSGAKGGTDRYYVFRAVSGSGKILESDPYYIPIDLNYYNVEIIATVAGVRDSDRQTIYAVLNGSGTRLRRGGSTEISVTPVSGYYLKSFSADDGYTVAVSYSLDEIATQGSAMTATKYATVTATDSDITVTVAYYKKVEVEYVNLTQTLQTLPSGTPVSVAVTPKESDFAERFGTLSYSVTYDGSSQKPTTLGRYEIKVSASGAYRDDYFIPNDSASLVISYFAGRGDADSPYLINSEKDLKYIDFYMDSRATSDYLGARRKTSRFRQTGNITLSKAFLPLGAGGADYTNAFSGYYDGCGYTISYSSIYPITGSFAIFQNIVSGATIMNLGVAYSGRTNGVVEDASIGLIVANAYGSGISGCFASGELIVTGKRLKVGGIVGYAENSRITNCFTDVKLNVSYTSGYVGGVAGYLAGTSYVANTYAIGSVSVSDSERYSATAPVGTEFIYGGAVTGYCAATAFPTAGNATYYLSSNISFDGIIAPRLPLGNTDYADIERLLYENSIIDFFAENMMEIVHSNISGKRLTVATLTAMRIDEAKLTYGLSGEGTANRPFLIDTAEKLIAVEILPWANFKQTNDITLTENRAYASSVPFVGVYDGGGYEIRGLQVRQAHSHNGGLFGVVGGTIVNVVIRNANLTYNAGGVSYFGIAAGMLTEGAVMENVVVSGALNVETSLKGEVYVGGLAGVATGAVLKDCVSLAKVDVSGVRAVVGGLVGQAQNGTMLDHLVSMTSLTLAYSGLADVGAAFGVVKDGAENNINNVVYLDNVSYATGKQVKIGIGYSPVDIDIPALEYALITTDITLLTHGTPVGEIVRDLNPYQGEGTAESPFHVKTYGDLLLVSNFMYAYFVLDNDIVIGDHNGDGKVDASDGYAFDYKPLGNGATFTGSFNGKYHSIIGLTDSLFAVNAGRISNVNLSLNYKVYAYAQDIPESEKVVGTDGLEHTSAKVVGTDEDTTFGAVCNELRSGGVIMRVQVTGSIDINLKGLGKAIVGGFVGKYTGGQVTASGMSASLKIRAAAVECGGIIGIISGGYNPPRDRIEDNTLSTSGSLDIGGASIRAGLYIGSFKVKGATAPEFVRTNTKLQVNGVDRGTQLYLGYDINNG